MRPNEQELRQALRNYAANIAAAHQPPPASAAWLRAERQKSRAARSSAERPLRVMQFVGLVLAALAACWLLLQPGSLQTFTSMGSTVPVLAIVSTLLTLFGCLLMLRLSRDTPRAGKL